MKLSEAELLASLSESERDRIIATLSDEQLSGLQFDWRFWARPKQLAPAGDWLTWVIRAGRGFGKTRSGSGWIHERAMAQPGRWMAMVGRTPADVRDFMIDGPGGLLKNTAPDERPIFESSKRRMTWPNGSWATIYSGDEPDQLRGFSGDTAWLDELAKYPKPRELWDNLQFGMREPSGDQPRTLITTTPRPLVLLKEIEAKKSTKVVIGSSHENRANLDPKWFDETLRPYEGTQLGRQEIYADILDLEETGIVKRSWFKLWPANKPLPSFHYVLLSYDTAYSNKTTADYTACTMWGIWRESEKKSYKAMLFDCWHERIIYPDLRDRILEDWHREYGQGIVPEYAMMPVIPNQFGPVRNAGQKPALVLIEEKSSGGPLLQDLARMHVIARGYNPGNADKTLRLHLVSDLIKDGFVYLAESEDEKRPGQPKSWYGEFLNQLCTFKGEKSIEHEDYVDSTTQALSLLRDQLWLKPKMDKKYEENDERPTPRGRQGNPYAQ